MPVQRFFRKILEVIVSSKAVVYIRSLLVRWKVDERVLSLVVLFSALPEILGWSRWYSNMGLQYGGLVGIAQPYPEKVAEWTLGHVIEVRMTAMLYATFIIAGFIGSILHIFTLSALLKPV